VFLGNANIDKSILKSAVVSDFTRYAFVLSCRVCVRTGRARDLFKTAKRAVLAEIAIGGR